MLLVPHHLPEIDSRCFENMYGFEKETQIRKYVDKVNVHFLRCAVLLRSIKWENIFNKSYQRQFTQRNNSIVYQRLQP